MTEKAEFIESLIWLYKARIEDVDTNNGEQRDKHIYRTLIGELEEELKLEIKKSP